MSLLLVAVALGVQAAPEPSEKVVTIKRKAHTWSFAQIPERRGKLIQEGREREVLVPPRLWAAWIVTDPRVPSEPLSLFEQPSQSLLVEFFEPGKRYGVDEGAALARDTQAELVSLIQTMLTRYYEFDLEFPGGTWEELGRVLKERLVAAYAQQTPDFLKPCFPPTIDIDVSVPSDYVVRYPALQGKGLTLAALRPFRMAPLLDVHLEPLPRLDRQEDGGTSLEIEKSPILGRWVLSDGNRLGGGALEVAFFNLGDRPVLAGAEDVVALFEMAWKSGGEPVFAQVKYHPETKTIMLRATPEEIAAARHAFASLTGRPAPVEPVYGRNPFDAITEALESIVRLLETQKKDK